MGEKDIIYQIRAVTNFQEATQAIGKLIELQKEYYKEVKKGSDTNKPLVNEQLGILESLKQKYDTLRESIQKATTVSELKAHNKELQTVEQQMQRLNGVGKDVSQTMGGMSSMLKNIALTMGVAFSIDQLQQFASKIIQVREDAIRFDSALNILVKTQKERAEITSKLNEIDAKSDYNLGELREATKSMLAYGFTQKQLLPDLESLLNLSSALGKDKMPQLVLAFGQVKAAGHLTGQELRQFTEAGVSMGETISKLANESYPNFLKRVSDGKVSFNEVEKALRSMTDEGGQFAGMLEANANKLPGVMSNWESSVLKAQNNIGKSFESNIISVTKFFTGLIDGLFGTEKASNITIDVIKALIGVFVAFTAVGKGSIATFLANTGAMLGFNTATSAKIVLTEAEIITTEAQIVATAGQTVATNVATTAQARLNATMSANPIGAVIAVLATLYALYQTYNALSEETASRQTKVNEASAEGIAKLEIQKDRLSKLSEEVRVHAGEEQRLAKIITDSHEPNEKRAKALEELHQLFPVGTAHIIEYKDAEQLLVKGHDARYDALKKLQLQYPGEFDHIKNLDTQQKEFEASVAKVNVALTHRGQLLMLEAEQQVIREELTSKLREGRQLKNTGKDTEVDVVGSYDPDTETRSESTFKKSEAKLQNEREVAKLLKENYDKALEYEEKTKNNKKEKDPIKAPTTNYEPAKQAHKAYANDVLLNEKNIYLAQEDSSQKKLQLLAIDKEIAIDKAKQEKKSAVEIEGIRLEHDNKYKETEEKLYKEEFKKASDFSKTIIKIEDDKEKEKQKILEKENKATERYNEQMRKLTLTNNITLTQINSERNKIIELTNATSNEQKIAIEEKYRKQEIENIQTVLINERTALAFSLENKKINGTLRIEEERRVNLEIAKLDNELLKLKEENTKEEDKTKKIIRDLRVKAELEALGMFADAFRQSESILLQSVGSSIQSFQKFRQETDTLGKGMTKTLKTVGLGVEVAGNLMQGIFKKNLEAIDKEMKLVEANYKKKIILIDKEANTQKNAINEKYNLLINTNASEIELLNSRYAQEMGLLEAKLAKARANGEDTKAIENEIQALKEKHNTELNALENGSTDLKKKNAEELDALEKETQKKKAQADFDRRKREYELRKQAFEEEKKAKIAQAIISGVQLAINAAISLASIPFVGWVLAPIAAAAALAWTASQVASISNNNFTELPPEAPEGLAKGTEYVDKKGKYRRGEDSVPAYLMPAERVVPVKENEQLEGVSNEKLPYYYRLGKEYEQMRSLYNFQPLERIHTSDIHFEKAPAIDYDLLAQKLGSKISDSIKSIPQPMVVTDEYNYFKQRQKKYTQNTTLKNRYFS